MLESEALPYLQPFRLNLKRIEPRLKAGGACVEAFVPLRIKVYDEGHGVGGALGLIQSFAGDTTQLVENLHAMFLDLFRFAIRTT